MKKILSVIVCFAMLAPLCACSSAPSTPIEALNVDERELYDALLFMSDSFFNPSEVRLLDVGDSAKMCIFEEDSEHITAVCNSVVVRVQGENKSGGVSNDYYRLYLTSLQGKALATAIAEYDFDQSDFWRKNWDECGEDEYPRSHYESFENYKAYLIKYGMNDDFFFNEEARDKAAEEYSKKSWDSCEADEYPRNSYSTYDEYLKFYYRYYADSKYIVANYDKEVSPVRDENFGKYEVLEDSSIVISEESKYDVSKINKALKFYWDEKLGNND